MDTGLATADTRPTRLRRIAGALRATFGLVVDVALPQLCASCREPVGDAGVCAACWSKLSFIAPPYCERLGIPFTYDPGPGILSMEAIADPPAYHRARAAVRYDDVARTLVHAFKYGDRLDLAPTMGRWMATAGRELLARPTRSCRCRCIGAGNGRGASTSRRCSPRSSPRQAACRSRTARSSASRRRRSRSGSRRPARAQNVQGAFRVPADGKAEVAGRRLILVDDVLTSGATMDACARALLRAGAAQVDVLVFARVVAAARNPI